jgi:hypothetical protein
MSRTLHCSECGNPGPTHEVLPRRLGRPRVYACAAGARLLPESRKRALTAADYGLPAPVRHARPMATSNASVGRG